MFRHDIIYYYTFGGTIREYVNDIAIDSSGNAYIAGYTESKDFPTTHEAFQENFNGGSSDVYVTKLTTLGTDIVFSTFLGGGGKDRSIGFVVDDYSNIYITGTTTSTSATFPISIDALKKRKSGIDDIFITKLNGNGTGIIYSSFLGGMLSDSGYGIKMDISGSIYIYGLTSSQDFPVINGIFDVGCYSQFDTNGSFIVKLLLEENTTVEKIDNWKQMILLNHPYPNPFNNSTTISFYLLRTMHIQLNIYNIQGQVIDTILSDLQKPGKHIVIWNAGNFSSGFYFCTIQGENVYKTEKILLLK